jgi:hypothetical protein
LIAIILLKPWQLFKKMAEESSVKWIALPDINPDHKYGVGLKVAGQRDLTPLQTYATFKELKKGYCEWARSTKKAGLRIPVPCRVNKKGKLEVLAKLID